MRPLHQVGPGLDRDQGLMGHLSVTTTAPAADPWPLARRHPRRRPRLQLSLLLSAPLAWLALAYLGSLTVLLLSAFWSTTPSPPIWSRRTPTTSPRCSARSTARSSRTGPSSPPPRHRALIAFPIAFFTAKSPRRAAAAPAGRRAHPTVGQLPGQGVRLAAHARRAGRWTGCWSRWDSRPGLRADRRLAGADLSVAAVHGPAHLRRARPDARLAARRLLRPRRPPPDLPLGDPADGPSGGGGRLDLHLLADSRRLHRRTSAARPNSSATSSTPTSASPTCPCGRPRHCPSRGHGPLPAGARAPGALSVSDAPVPPAAATPGGHRGPRLYLRATAAGPSNSFNPARVAPGPPRPHLRMVGSRWDNPGARDALWTSVRAGFGATPIALVLGTFFVRRAALQVLRTRGHLLPGRPADRTPGDRHRCRAQHRLPRS